jgi:hypothetical protein
MTLPPSQTRSCNSALAHLGESHRITAIDDGSPLAKLFVQVWDEAVEEVLAAHPWNKALGRASLPASGDFTPDGSQYDFAYEKPADCVRWLPYRSDHPDYFEGEEEGDYILSNAAAPIIIRYIRREENIVKWSPGMRAVLAAKLARKLAKPITGQSGMMDRMETLFEAELAEAKRQDGAATGERARGMETRSTWLVARNRPWTGR